MDVETPLRTDPVAGATLLRENRALLIRHALDLGVVRRYGAAFHDNFKAYMDGAAEASSEPGRFARFRNEFFRDLHVRAGLAPHALVRSIATSPAMETLFAYFGTDRIASSWDNLISALGMWRHNGPEHGMPWHQAGMDPGGLLVRAWILIYPESAGDVSPGLEFLPTRGLELLTVEQNPTSLYTSIETSHEALAVMAQRQSTWAPIVRLGDVVLFTGDCLVRTRFPEGGPYDRLAIQATFFNTAHGICCTFTRNGVEFPTDDGAEALARGNATGAAYELIR